MFHTIIKSRNFLSQLNIPFELIPDNCSWSVYGGCYKALFDLNINESFISSLIQYLRCPVEISDSNGFLFWWGYINEIRLFKNDLVITISLDKLFNKVSVFYTVSNPGFDSPGLPVLSPWASNLDSQSFFGIKSIILEDNVLSNTEALSTRDIFLAHNSFIKPTFDLSKIPKQGFLKCQFICSGWFETFKWQYYDNPAGYIGNEILGSSFTWCYAENVNSIAESFSLLVPWKINTVSLRFKRQSISSSNSIIVSICLDNAGVPMTTEPLATLSIPGANMPFQYFEWRTYNFTTPILLSAGVTHWLVISRSGSTDYYAFDLDEGLSFTGGVFKYHNGSAWVSRSPDADLNFILGGTQDTISQIGLMSGINYGGQFLSQIDLPDLSYILTSPYRDGLSTAHKNIIDLLDLGDFSGSPLFCNITSSRVFTVYPQPPISSPAYLINSNSNIYDPFDSPIPPYKSIVGNWLKLKSDINYSPSSFYPSHPSLTFVRSQSYDFINHKLNLSKD